MSRARSTRVTVLLASVVMAAAAHAQDRPARIKTFQTENDFFARWADSDRHYTNGLRAALTWRDNGADDWLSRLVFRWDPLVKSIRPKGERWVGIATGQSIFTPEDTDRDDLIRTDRPYAGWLYVSGAVNYRYDATDGTRDGVQDTFAIELGVIGPYAGAEEVQNGFHDLIDVSRSRGWRNQLGNEPGVNFIFERKYRIEPIELGKGISIDVIPNAAASLGNVATYGAAGGILRIGSELARDFGPPRIRPSLPGSELFDGGRFGWYVFAGAEGEVVGHNVFLDGSTFRASHGVDKNRLVGDFQAGLVAFVGSLRLSYSHVFRSPEFDGQLRWNQFGALSLSCRF